MATRTKKQPTLADQLAEQRRRVDFDSYDISTQQLVAMVTQGQIDVAPTYQRQFRWDEGRQSQLIESIFLGIPIPSLFMATNASGTWEVVDGVQRLSTLIRYAGSNENREALSINGGPLRLNGLEKLSSLNGLIFSDLPLPVQTQFLLRAIKATTLSDKSDLKVRFDLFERLNTGGVRLSNQEIRGCIYRGRFNDFLESMASSDEFRKVVLLKDSAENDGTREEYALRFFALLNNYKSFDHSVVDFLNDYMSSAARKFDYKAGEKIFRETFAALSVLFPNGITRTNNNTPVALFEAISVGAAIALQKNAALKSKTMKTWIDDPKLKALTTAATNNRSSVTGRIEFVASNFGA